MAISYLTIACLANAAYFLIPVAAQSTSLPLPDANITASIQSVCRQMKGMPGCTLQTSCADSQSHQVPSQYCQPFSIYASLCATDMPMMSDCRPYASVCGSSTNASAACAAYPPLPQLPTTAQVTHEISSICTEMSMSGCEKCVIQPGASYAECDLLGVYSGLCKSMPGMSQCGEWKSMCRATPGLGFCQQDASQDAPVMKMFFHTGISDYVLLENWVPRNGGQYAGAWIGTFLLGLVFEITTTLHYLLEARRTRYELEAVTPLSKSYTVMIAVTRGLIRMWVAFLAYILMLVVMTYNVGLFFAAIVGLGAGAAVFGGVAKRAAVRAGVDTKQSEELCC